MPSPEAAGTEEAVAGAMDMEAGMGMASAVRMSADITALPVHAVISVAIASQPAGRVRALPQWAPAIPVTP